METGLGGRGSRAAASARGIQIADRQHRTISIQPDKPPAVPAEWLVSNDHGYSKKFTL